MVEHERVLRGSTSRTMAAISLGFIVIVTPYTIQEVVAACTGSKVITEYFFLWPLPAKYERVKKRGKIKAVDKIITIDFRVLFRYGDSRSTQTITCN